MVKGLLFTDRKSGVRNGIRMKSCKLMCAGPIYPKRPDPSVRSGLGYEVNQMTQYGCLWKIDPPLEKMFPENGALRDDLSLYHPVFLYNER